MWKWLTRSVIAVTALSIAGFCFFGSEVYSYVTSSGRMLQESVEDSVPFEFQLRRARDLLDDVVPEMHANIRLIAKEEVEIVDLERDIAEERGRLQDASQRVKVLRDALRTDQATYRFGRDSAAYSRDEVISELSLGFERLQTAELTLQSKEKLLDNRRAALRAAQKKLEKLRLTRLELAGQIEQLESQFRLVQAESATSRINVDDGKVAQVHKVLGDLRKRLQVSQRMLAHESRFIENIPVDTVDEGSLLDSVDAHFEVPAAEDDGDESSL